MNDNGTVPWVKSWYQWRKWIGGSAEDTLITDFKRANRPLPSDGLIECSGFSAIQLLTLGQDANNETAYVRVTGWMDNCPGFVLWDGTVTLGSTSVANETFEGWVASGTWFHTDTFTATNNAAQGEAFAATDLQGFLTIPTHGYAYLSIEAQEKDGSTSTQMASLVSFWRPQSASVVI